MDHIPTTAKQAKEHTLNLTGAKAFQMLVEEIQEIGHTEEIYDGCFTDYINACKNEQPDHCHWFKFARMIDRDLYELDLLQEIPLQILAHYSTALHYMKEAGMDYIPSNKIMI